MAHSMFKAKWMADNLRDQLVPEAWCVGGQGLAGSEASLQGPVC